jgi:hypothetical protein
VVAVPECARVMMVPLGANKKTLAARLREIRL